MDRQLYGITHSSKLSIAHGLRDRPPDKDGIYQRVVGYDPLADGQDCRNAYILLVVIEIYRY